MIGSYFVAQEVRVKRPRRKAAAAPAGANGHGESSEEDVAAAIEDAERAEAQSR